ncbi:MAG: hypothetical protein AB7F94_04390 [Nitrospira sp.]
MRDHSNGATFGLNQNDIAVEHRAGGTHPGTEQRPVCRRFMLSMVSSVFGCLSLGQTADGKNAEYE